MHIRLGNAICIALLLGLNASSSATELSECLTLTVKPNGDAILANGCLLGGLRLSRGRAGLETRPTAAYVCKKTCVMC